MVGLAVVVLGLSCERPLVFGSGSVAVRLIFGEKKCLRASGKGLNIPDLKSSDDYLVLNTFAASFKIAFILST